jgi:hypothetical protein
MIKTLRIGAAIAIALCTANGLHAQEAEELLEDVRAALGQPAFAASGAVIELTGDLRHEGTDARYSLAFDGSGRYLERIEGPLSGTTGHDGETVWRIDSNGTPQVLVFGDRDANLLLMGRWTGAWLDAGLSFELDMYDRDTVVLSFEHAASLVTGTLELDLETNLPVRWEWTANGRENALALSGWTEVAGLQVPTAVVRTEGQAASEHCVTNEYRLEARALERLPDPSPQLAMPDDWRIDPEASPALEVRRATTGHLLVHPLIDGEDLGWFIFDTGAGVNVISTHVLELLEAPTFGESTARGVGGEVEMTYVRPGPVELGPLTLTDPLFAAMDLEFLSAPLGVEIGGVLGYGTISRCIVEYSFGDSGIRLLDPHTYGDEGGEEGLDWQELVLYHRTPHVRGMLEGEEALFIIDTGAVGGSALTVYGETVKRRNMLADRETGHGMAGGVGGMVRIRTGTVRSLELGGHEFETIPAAFATESKGAFSNPYVDGNVGAELLEGLTMTLDYSSRRISLTERPGH